MKSEPDKNGQSKSWSSVTAVTAEEFHAAVTCEIEASLDAVNAVAVAAKKLGSMATTASRVQAYNKLFEARAWLLESCREFKEARDAVKL